MIDGGGIRTVGRRDTLGLLARGAAAGCVVLWLLASLAGGLWLVQKAVTMPTIRTELVLRVEQGRPWTSVQVGGDDLMGIMAHIKAAKAEKLAKR